jgi:hypothetical protein
LFISFFFVIPSKGQSAYLGGWYFLVIEAGFFIVGLSNKDKSLLVIVLVHLP